MDVFVKDARLAFSCRLSGRTYGFIVKETRQKGSHSRRSTKQERYLYHLTKTSTNIIFFRCLLAFSYHTNRSLPNAESNIDIHSPLSRTRFFFATRKGLPKSDRLQCLAALHLPRSKTPK